MKKLLGFSLCFQLFLVAPVMGQATNDIVAKTQNDLLVVAGAGAAGAVIGLSTLSFVDQPSQHLRNIWTGAALGIIAGVIYVAYDSAQKGSEDLQSSNEFSTYERYAWHSESHNLEKSSLSKNEVSGQFWQVNF